MSDLPYSISTLARRCDVHGLLCYRSHHRWATIRGRLVMMGDVGDFTVQAAVEAETRVEAREVAEGWCLEMAA